MNSDLIIVLAIIAVVLFLKWYPILWQSEEPTKGNGKGLSLLASELAKKAASSGFVGVLLMIGGILLMFWQLFPDAWNWTNEDSHAGIFWSGLVLLLLVIAWSTFSGNTRFVMFIFGVGALILFSKGLYTTLSDEGHVGACKGKKGAELSQCVTRQEAASNTTRNSPPAAKSYSATTMPTFCWRREHIGPGANQSTSSKPDCSAIVTYFKYEKSPDDNVFVQLEYKLHGASGVATLDTRVNPNVGGWTLMSADGRQLDGGVFKIAEDGDGYSGTMISYYDERGNLLPRGEYGQLPITISF